MGKMKEKMAEDLEMRCYRPGTIEAYLRQAERFAGYFMRSPAEMGEEHIR